MKEEPIPVSPTRAFFNLKVIRDAAITLGLVLMGGFLLGVSRAAFSIPDGTYAKLTDLTNICGLFFGGIIAAYRLPRLNLIRHLAAVGILVWSFCLLNLALGYMDIFGFIYSGFFVAALLSVGGFFSWFFFTEEK